MATLIQPTSASQPLPGLADAESAAAPDFLALAQAAVNAFDPKDVLNAQTSDFVAQEPGWAAEERRFYGGRAMLGELAKFTGEPDAHYLMRQAWARPEPFAFVHAYTLAGQLARVRPQPGKALSMGKAGPVRAPADISAARASDPNDKPRPGELTYYNCDSVAANGNEFPTFTTQVQMAACATGHRFAFVEMPALEDIRRLSPTGRMRAGRPVDYQDVVDGFRPYYLHWSPRQVPYAERSQGAWDVVVARVPVPRRLEAGKFSAFDPAPGYYLTLRAGTTAPLGALADLAAEWGAWFVFDSERTLVRAGTFRGTRGEIPLATLIAGAVEGTAERPALSRSLTFELGQLSADLMNAMSERRFDARNAAKNIRFIKGVKPDDTAPFALTASMMEGGAILVPLQSWYDEASKTWVHPDLAADTFSPVPEGVFKAIMDDGYAEAERIMIRQVMATPDSSGRSKETGFALGASPLLSAMAEQRQRFEQALIWYTELRSGSVPEGASPEGYAAWPRDVELKPAVTAIQDTMRVLRDSGQKSKTLSAHLVKAQAQENGTWPEDEDVAARAEAELAADAPAPANPFAL